MSHTRRVVLFLDLLELVLKQLGVVHQRRLCALVRVMEGSVSCISRALLLAASLGCVDIR